MGDRPSRVTIYPREAAALSRLLDAYAATVEHEPEHEPGLRDLRRFEKRINRLNRDHTLYDRYLQSG